MLKWLEGQASVAFLHISLILSGSCDRLQCGTREWILILKTRHLILPNTKRPFWSTWSMNTVPNIDVCWSIETKAYRAAISSPPQRLLNPVNHPSIHMIWPAMMNNTSRQPMVPRRHPHEAIVHYGYLLPPGSIWIPRLKHQRTGSKLIQISMITTLTQ